MTFTVQGLRADNRGMSSSRPVRASGSRSRESGQVVVEFALLLPVFVILITGLIQFGLALNFWLDMQRVANQGARWAAVNNWPPACPQGGVSGACSSTYQKCADATASGSGATLQQVLYCSLLTKSEADTSACSGAACVKICYPNNGSTALGDPVKVSISRPFNIIGIPFVGGFASVTLKANATMRLEQSQAPPNGLISGTVASC
jgi:Flp pilus assembly protein TadG